MSTDLLLNVAWVLLLILLGAALPAGIGAMAGRSGPGKEWLRGRLLLAALLAVLLSFACGFSLQYGIVHLPDLGEGPRLAWQWEPFGQGSGVLAWAGPGLPAGDAPGPLLLFLWQAVGAVTVVVLALAPVGRRLPAPGLVGAAVCIAGLLYPLFGHWVWGGGWLAAVGDTAYLGHGLVDYGGSGVIYALGGLLALGGLTAARIRRKEGAVPHGPSLGGALLVLLGVIALNLAAAWEMAPHLGMVAVNTLLAAVAGGAVAAIYMAFTTTRLHPAMLGRGLVAGAVASAGLAPFAPPTTLLLVGGGAGLLAALGSYLVERLWHLDDRLGIVPAFGLAGLWGLLAVGLFADGRYGQGWNGVAAAGSYLGVPDQGISGIALLAPGRAPDYGQLAAQALGVAALLLWALGVGWLLFRLASVRRAGEGAPDVGI